MIATLRRLTGRRKPATEHPTGAARYTTRATEDLDRIIGCLPSVEDGNDPLDIAELLIRWLTEMLAEHGRAPDASSATSPSSDLAVERFRDALIAHFCGSESQTLGLDPHSGGIVDAWCDVIADFQMED